MSATVNQPAPVHGVSLHDFADANRVLAHSAGFLLEFWEGDAENAPCLYVREYGAQPPEHVQWKIERARGAFRVMAYAENNRSGWVADDWLNDEGFSTAREAAEAIRAEFLAGPD